MKKNMGSTDKIIRLILAAVFIILFMANIVAGALGYILLGLAVVFILTSVVSFCPLYTLINANTCPVKEKETK
jgi:hypothetical protein